jgi:hydrogenase maturation protease
MRLAEVVATPLLIYGIGNMGRQDDGLGPLLVERLAEAKLPAGVTLESGYQLSPEDALALSHHDTVLFVDATRRPGARGPYTVEAVAPASEVSFSTHAMGMGALLALCARLYGRAPRGYALAIPASRFEINAPISAEAEANLKEAVSDLLEAMRPRRAR